MKLVAGQDASSYKEAIEKHRESNEVFYRCADLAGEDVPETLVLWFRKAHVPYMFSCYAGIAPVAGVPWSPSELGSDEEGLLEVIEKFDTSCAVAQKG